MRDSLITYWMTSLSKLISDYSNEELTAVLSGFSCRRDLDVEVYLKSKSVQHELRHVSRTYLIFDMLDHSRLVAYYTLAIRCLRMDGVGCSRKMRDRMNIHNGMVQSCLIGQIGKCDGAPKGLGTFAIGLHWSF